MGKLRQESYGARGICGLECETRSARHRLSRLWCEVEAAEINGSYFRFQ
jgi:hypothetical protein